MEGSNVTLKCDSQKLKRRDPLFDPVEWSVVFADSVNGIETILKPTNSVVLPTGNFNGMFSRIVSELGLYFLTLTTTGVQIKFSVETENDVSLLEISNVSIAMSGTYVCRSMFHGSENSVQLSSNSFSINVLSKFQLFGKQQRVAKPMYKLSFPDECRES
jgi:hypothetical protein